MTSRFAFIFAISFSILFGVDKPKEIDLPPQTVTEIQFDSELFQQNHLVKKGMSERDKKALARMGISQMRKNNIANFKSNLNELQAQAKVRNKTLPQGSMRKGKISHQTSTQRRSRSTGVEFEFDTIASLYEAYGDVLATNGDGCDGCPGNLDTMEEVTSFAIFRQDSFEAWASDYGFTEYYFQFIDENETGEYDDGEIYAVSCEGSDENQDLELYMTVAYDGSVYDLEFEDFWMQAYDFDWEEDDDGNDESEFLGTFNGHEYYVSSFGATWSEAYQMSLEEEVHLVTISSQEENDFIFEHTGGGVWIGFTDQEVEGNWEWVTGEDVGYTNWDDGEPNNDGENGQGQNWAHMIETGQWDDLEDEEMLFVLEVGSNHNENFDFVGEFNGHEYYISNAGGDYHNGLDMCADAGGHLVTITSQGEQDFVLAMLMQYGGGANHLWLGLDDLDNDGIYTWVTGEEINYDISGWNQFESGRAVEMATPEGTWNAVDPGDGQDFRRYMLEIDEGQDFELTDYEITINGESEAASIEAGESATLVINFDMNTGSEPYAGMMGIHYDVDFDDEVNPEIDLNLFEEEGEGPAVLVVDNMEPDVNPAVGVIEIELNAEEGDEGLGFLTMFQGATWHFTRFDPEEGFGGSTALLDVVSFNSDYSISGHTNPPTPNMMVYAFQGDDEDEDEDEDREVLSMAVTQLDGSYFMSVENDDVYMVGCTDALELNENLFASPGMHFVNVQGHEVDIDFNIESFDAMVSGIVTNPEGDGIGDAEVIFSYHEDYNNVHIESDTRTDDMGHYELWLQADYEYEVMVFADGYNDWYGNVMVNGDMQHNVTLNPQDNNDDAMVSGIVTNPEGDGIGDAEVIFSYHEDYNNVHMESNTWTNDMGHYELWLQAGYEYEVKVLADGYNDWYGNVMVNGDMQHDVTLYPQDNNIIPPHIEHARDVPNDQGRQMRLVWSPGNPGGMGYFEFFSIWRETGTGGMYLWDFIDVVPWHGMEPYSAVVPTLGDSTDMGIHWSTFRVTAHTGNPNNFYDSEPVSGYSIDNIHPGVPGGVQAFTGDDGILITWNSSMDLDFGYHRIYRYDTDSSVPAIEFTTVDTFYVDDAVEGNYEYWITAVDVNGNESDPSIIVTVTLAIDNGLAVPMDFALQQNYPNPFNPSTQIQYALPRDAKVTIAIYDLAGRRIRTLVNEQVSAGFHSTLWNATSDMGSPVSAGVYIYTITANDFRDVKKMILLK